MTVYKPKQRSVRARVLTEAGWIQGNFNIPPTALFLEYLNRPGTIDNLTDVTIEQYRLTCDFLQLQRRSIILMHFFEDYPDLQDRAPGENLTSRHIFCLLDRGIIRGHINLLRNLRVSDHFNNKRGFVPLTNCRYLLALPPPEGKTESRHDLMLVNTDHLLGVSDNIPNVQTREAPPAANG
jgi:hypothetical protein